MKTDQRGKYEKILLILTSPIIIIVMVVILFNSAISKYIVEKYDEKYTGRKITMDRAYVNPLTGYIYFSNLKIYELNSDSLFLSIDGIGANISLLKLFSGTFEISKLILNHPSGAIIQNRKTLNINDLIDKFSSKGNPGTIKSHFHFSIINIRINEGEFYYKDRQIPISYFIKKVNIESTGKLRNLLYCPA